MIDISPEAVEALATILESQNDYFTAPKLRALRAALADAQAVGFAAGVGAAAKYIDRRVNNYLDEHGIFDGETGVTEFPGNGEEWVADQEETAEAIRALTPTDATAAAARVLLGVWPTDASFDAAFNACAASYHGGDQMQDEMDRTLATVSAALRAIAGDTP